VFSDKIACNGPVIVYTGCTPSQQGDKLMAKSKTKKKVTKKSVKKVKKSVKKEYPNAAQFYFLMNEDVLY